MITWINLCLYGVPPAPVYKGVEEGEGRPSLWCPLGAVLLPPGVGFPLSSSRSRSQGKGREKRRKEGAQPLPLVQFGLGLGEVRSLSSLFPLMPNKAHILPGEFP